MRKLIIFIVLFGLVGQGSIYADQKSGIEIVCFGQTESFVLDYLKEKLSEIFNVRVSLGKTFGIPQYAYNKQRNQYQASDILDEFAEINSSDKKILAIIDKDIYVPELNFLFGLADSSTGICILSLTRLRQSYYGLPEDRQLFLERCLKEAVHEIGHLYGLDHCSNSKCVMYFSNSLLDTDKKDYNFCDRCRRLLRNK